MAEIFSGSEFVREISVDSRSVDLKIYQYSVGDVGCVVWDAGLVLAKYLDCLQSSSNYVLNKSVIDIGSGTGVVGLFAAALGADVILTDLPEFVPLLEKNVQSNKDILLGSTSTAALVWGEDIDKFNVPDLLLASDCIYYDKCVQTLIPTLIALSSEKTDILISYEDRDIGNKRELLRDFLIEMKKYFEINFIPVKEQHSEYRSPDIHILRCKKKTNLNCVE